MTSDQLGRRYERLLFLSGPLTLVAAMVLLVAFSSTTQNERVLATCFDVASKTIRDNKEALNIYWRTYEQEKRKSKYAVNSYMFELSKVWISPGISSGCYDEIHPILEQAAETPPVKIIENFDSRVKQLRATPLQFRGIEIPEKVEISIFATNIKINLESFTALLQVSLAPVLIIWLGSLYNTRYRESLLVGKANDIAAMFPHLINVYPAGDIPIPRKRSRLAYWLPPAKIIPAIYSLIRVGLIVFVIAPSVGCYLISLFLLPIEGLGWLSFIIGLLVVIFAASVVTAEILPWHVMKIFPGVARK